MTRSHSSLCCYSFVLDSGMLPLLVWCLDPRHSYDPFCAVTGYTVVTLPIIAFLPHQPPPSRSPAPGHTGTLVPSPAATANYKPVPAQPMLPAALREAKI